MRESKWGKAQVKSQGEMKENEVRRVGLEPTTSWTDEGERRKMK